MQNYHLPDLLKIHKVIRLLNLRNSPPSLVEVYSTYSTRPKSIPLRWIGKISTDLALNAVNVPLFSLDVGDPPIRG